MPDSRDVLKVVEIALQTDSTFSARSLGGNTSAEEQDLREEEIRFEHSSSVTGKKEERTVEIGGEKLVEIDDTVIDERIATIFEVKKLDSCWAVSWEDGTLADERLDTRVKSDFDLFFAFSIMLRE